MRTGSGLIAASVLLLVSGAPLHSSEATTDCSLPDQAAVRWIPDDVHPRLCDKASNEWGCATFVEDYLLRYRASDRVRREGSVLSIRTEQGAPLEFRDVMRDDYSRAGRKYPICDRCYYYQGRLPSGHAVVFTQGYEDITFHIINMKDGREIVVPDVPIFSPSGERFAVVGDDYGDGWLEIWHLADGSRWEQEWTSEGKYRGYPPRGVKWLSDEEIRHCVRAHKAREYSEAVLRLRDQQWTHEHPSGE